MKRRVLCITLAALLAIATAFALTGCKNGSGDSTASGNGMTQKIETGLKTLVSNKTVTQAQADKIKTALESRLGSRGFSGSRPERQQNGSRPDFQNGGQGGAGGSMPDFQNGSRPAGGRMNNMLASLVKDGTITQTQADKVVETIFGSSNFGGGPGGGQNGAPEN